MVNQPARNHRHRRRRPPALIGAVMLSLLGALALPRTAFAAPGSELWARRYGGSTVANDQAFAVGVSPDGSEVFVTGAAYATATKYDYATLAYDASTGARLWTNTYDDTGTNDIAVALAVSPHGLKVFVTGASHGSGNGDDYLTAAYRASTGATLWTKRYDGPGHRTDAASAVAVSPDGSRVFVTGSSIAPGTHQDYLTIAYDSAGKKLWTRRYDGPDDNYDAATALRVSPDGSTVFVTGQTTPSTGEYDYTTLAYDASSGHRSWARS
jgi:PQQ-like domain